MKTLRKIYPKIKILSIIFRNLGLALCSAIKSSSMSSNIEKINRYHHCTMYKTNPIATFIAMGSPTSGPVYDAARDLVIVIIDGIKNNYSEAAIIQYIQSQYEFTISHSEIVYSVGVGLSEQWLDFDTLAPEWYTLPSALSSSSSSASSSSSSSASSSSSSSTPRDESISFLTSIGNFISDHKIGIIVTGVVVVAGVIIAYVIYKRRTPPGDSASMIELPTQSSSTSTSSSVSKMVFIIKNLTRASVVSSGLFLFSYLISITTILNHAL